MPGTLLADAADTQEFQAFTVDGWLVSLEQGDTYGTCLLSSAVQPPYVSVIYEGADDFFLMVRGSDKNPKEHDVGIQLIFEGGKEFSLIGTSSGHDSYTASLPTDEVERFLAALEGSEHVVMTTGADRPSEEYSLSGGEGATEAFAACAQHLDG
ncbi:hypothetical protein [Tranquillimonas alkanivorans]|uniref:Uncharacterized protein n=1 Tax=Tranquillimonas alkanivorans TaxID=441119 RepID=A0A1I5WCZ6_9RHOB|nr:hypothetical protein [Tranquillimonas alkanivorans]SFQ17609.1 hypothetical protein SAMN04488047_1445 [Tranquillimonas alkanivorans]